MRRASIVMACVALMGATECTEDDADLVGEHRCTTELRSAVHVHVSGDISDVKSVTAENTRGEVKCTYEVLWEDAGTTAQRTYVCWEQEPGQYTIRVHLEDETLTEMAVVGGNECHVESPPQRVEFELP